MDVKAVIFDMDGVIFDSERIVYELWLELSEQYGFPDLRTPYWKVIGVNARQARETFLDFYGPDFPYDFYKSEQSRLYHERYDGGRLPGKPDPAKLPTPTEERESKSNTEIQISKPEAPIRTAARRKQS